MRSLWLPLSRKMIHGALLSCAFFTFIDSTPVAAEENQTSQKSLRVLCTHKDLPEIDLEWSSDKTARLFFNNQEVKLNVIDFRPACWRCRAFATIDWEFQFSEATPSGWPNPKDRTTFRYRRSVEQGFGYGISGIAVAGYSCTLKSPPDEELAGLRSWDPSIPDRHQR